MSGFGIRTAFDIGRKTLRSQLAGLNVTGNNIANVNTKGYSRQEVVLKPDITIATTEGVFGTGVTLGGVRRIRDQLIDRQVRTEMQTKGQNEALERVYNQVEATINEPSETGLRILISEFFDNWADLANDPENTTMRFNLREQAKVMVESFHQIDKQLRILSDDIHFELERGIERANTLISNIAGLNNKILLLEGGAQGTANDLRDQRDRDIDELSTMMDIYAFEKVNGVVEIASPARTLVTANFPTEMELVVTNTDGNLRTTIVDASDGEEMVINNGRLNGLMQARNEIVPYYRERFDELAYNLITRVNNVHNIGVGIQGTANEIPYDNNFFTGVDAVSMEVSDTIINNENAIAAARKVITERADGTFEISGAPGDNRIALEIAELKQARVLNNGTQSLIDYLNSVVSEVGIGAKTAHDNVMNHESLITEFQNLRDSTSGVSLDEEFINLTKFQRGFQAGARVITTVNDMFETLINM
ncbi:MAG: flagellar hook-associated protein FlgK [bacterium]|nr:flagellar hook-associated protein FlgK [bacterium]